MSFLVGVDPCMCWMMIIMTDCLCTSSLISDNFLPKLNYLMDYLESLRYAISAFRLHEWIENSHVSEIRNR